MEWVLRPPQVRWPVRMGRGRLAGVSAAVLLVIALFAEAGGVLAHRAAAAQAASDAALAAARSVRDARPAALAALAEAGVAASDLAVTVSGPGDTGGLELGQPVTRIDLRLKTRAPSALLGWLPLGLSWPATTRAAAETVGQVALTVPTDLAAASAPLRAALLEALYGLDAADSEIVVSGLAGTAVPLDDLLALLADQGSPVDAEAASAPGDGLEPPSIGVEALFTGLAARASLPRTRIAFMRLAARAGLSEDRLPVAGLVEPGLAGTGFTPSVWSIDALDLVVGAGLRAAAATPIDLTVPNGGHQISLSLSLPDGFAATPVVRRVVLGDTLRLPRVRIGLSVGIGGALLAAIPSLTLPIDVDAGGGTITPRRIDCRARGGETLAALMMAPGPVGVRFGGGEGGADDGIATFDAVDGLVLKAIGSRALAAPDPQPVAFSAAAAVARRAEAAQGTAEMGPALRTLLATADIRLRIAATAPEPLLQTGDARVRAAAAQLLAEAGAPAAAVLDQVTDALGLDPDRVTAIVLGVDCRGARLVSG